MTIWTPYPYPGSSAFTAENLVKNWDKLHAGDAEPLPLRFPMCAQLGAISITESLNAPTMKGLGSASQA
jgi:hypothetical protein